MARPRHQPDQLSRRQVEALAGYGVREPDIAGMLGIGPKTLRKHYRSELDLGHVKANAKVAENLYRRRRPRSGHSRNLLAEGKGALEGSLAQRAFRH